VEDRDVSELGRASGIPLVAYSRNHVDQCVQRVLVRTGEPEARSLARLIRRDPHARSRFRRSLLAPVTRMFRDPAEFDLLDAAALPCMTSRGRVSVWSAGCATGEELRTVAGLLDAHGVLEGSRLIGTDVLEEALAGARTEWAPLARRAIVSFEHRDLILDPPPTGKFDLVLCRNVAIYFEPSAQRALHRKLVSVLRPRAFLMLGSSEQLLRPETLGLEPVGRHIYRRSAG